MLGIRHVVLAVNKMDLMDYSESTFNIIVEDYHLFAQGLGFASVQAIPLSGLEGDIVLLSNPRMPGCTGPSLMAYLDSVDVWLQSARKAFRMPVQWVNTIHDVGDATNLIARANFLDCHGGGTNWGEHNRLTR
jgi:bifunctional enzyme CysN/CysC